MLNGSGVRVLLHVIGINFLTKEGSSLIQRLYPLPHPSKNELPPPSPTPAKGGCLQSLHTDQAHTGDSPAGSILRPSPGCTCFATDSWSRDNQAFSDDQEVRNLRKGGLISYSCQWGYPSQTLCPGPTLCVTDDPSDSKSNAVYFRLDMRSARNGDVVEV